MNKTATRPKGTRACAWAKWLFLIGLAALAAGLIAPLAGLSPMLAMLLISIGLLLFIVSGICGGIGLIRSGGTGGASSSNFAWLGVIAGIAALLNTVATMRGAGNAPIHDISTDTDNPPQFVEVAKLRAPNENPAEYAGPETAAIQQAAYPDIDTLSLLVDYSTAFEAALQVAGDMGWEIVAADVNLDGNDSLGRIEATATTPYVGFKDDVVIRIQAGPDETLVDVRSKSRIGRGDMGVNARRIREFGNRLLETVNR